MTRDEVQDLLGGVPLLAPATETELQRLAASAQRVVLERGEVLFTAGEPAEHLHVVVEGRLAVQVSSPRGDVHVLTLVGAGSSLGELGVLDGGGRSATVEARERTTLLALPGTLVRDVVLASPALALAWAQELAATVRRLTGSSADLVFLDLPRRLAKLLVEPQEEAVVLGASQSEIAAQLGVARQSLNRALAGLQRRGWVEVDGATVRLRDRAALERFVDS